MGIDDRPNTGSDISAPRRGLGTIRDAIRLRPFNIGYLGASVTAQRSGYVAPLHAELVRRTGQAHQAIVAAIGGLGSISGAFLMDDLLRDRTPDLCFVEFTTTDVEGYTPLHQVGPAVEGILRKLIRQGVQPVLLHLFRIDTEYGPGNPVISAYERVAEHYGVPSINLAEQWMRDQAWSQGAYLRDSVHLSEAGAVVCAGQILDELLALPEGSGPDESAAEGPPLHHDANDGTTIVRAKVKMLDQRARASRRLFRFNYPFLEIEPGCSLRFEAEKGVTGLLVVVGPRSGRIDVEDPAGVRQYELFDQYCHYERLNTVILTRGASDVRRVSVCLSLDEVDTSICRVPPTPYSPSERRLSIVGFLART